MSQIFQKKYPKEDFFLFLDTFCEKKDKQLIFSKVAYKKIQLEKQLEPFLENLKNYYFPSKFHYLEREHKYKHFVTVIRQICKYHHIPFTSNIKYSKSKYEIKYFIYCD